MREIKFRFFNKKTNELLTDFNKGCGYELLCIADMLNNDDYIPMQYTGLKDSKGVDIYVGDFVKTKYGINYIESLEELFYYIGDSDGCLQEKLEEGEIIGNIYQNPELK